MENSLCSFTSRARYIGGVDCGSPVTHTFDGALLCRDHYIYESRAYAVCNSCHAPKYEDVRVFEIEHTCSAIDAGADCMHFEDTRYCTCESDALVALCQNCDEFLRLVEDSTYCQNCYDGFEEEDRFYHATYNSQ
jgi:hypothetical protein